MDQLKFTIPEILSLIGVTQCVYILVYMLMRAGKISRAGLPILYFTVLACAFLSDFAANYIGKNFEHYFYTQWALWFMGPPLSVLLVIQIAKISETPALKYYGILGLVPLAFLGAAVFSPPEEIKTWLTLLGIIAGCISLLAIWGQRGLFASVAAEKTGKPRYWLILALVFTNVFFLASMLFSLSLPGTGQEILLVRTILGLGFVYLVGTSLFRIYPQAVKLPDAASGELSPGELAVARKIEGLLVMEKVYQEPAYSRADLARECGISEAILSRVINLHFQKTFPQLMNEHRIGDACRLLKETGANVRTVAEEVGFNSLATFNRVFKEITGVTPGQYRQDIAA
jgi:AraC-like DNA-binding protein